MPLATTSEHFHGGGAGLLAGTPDQMEELWLRSGMERGARMIDLDCCVGRFAGRKDRSLGGTKRGGKVQHPRASRAKVSLVAGAAPGRTVKERNVSSQKCFRQSAFPDEPLLCCVSTTLSLCSPLSLITSQALVSSSYLRLKATVSHPHIFTPL